jgi:hypothetical protein
LRASLVRSLKSNSQRLSKSGHPCFEHAEPFMASGRRSPFADTSAGALAPAGAAVFGPRVVRKTTTPATAAAIAILLIGLMILCGRMSCPCMDGQRIEGLIVQIFTK